MNLNHMPDLRIEDFPDQSDWIGNLFLQINPFTLAVQQLFNNNIDFNTNIKSVTKSYQIEFSNYSTENPFLVSWPYTDVSPQTCTIVQAYKTGSSPTAIICSWKFNASTREILIYSFTEILYTAQIISSGNYSFTIRVTV